MILAGIAWDQIAVGVAAILGLIYVARTLRCALRDTLVFLGNHLSSIAAALEATAINLQSLNERVDRLHDNHMEMKAVPKTRPKRKAPEPKGKKVK